MFETVPPHLEKFKPNLDKIFGIVDNESYRISFCIPIYHLDDIESEYIQHTWESLYRDLFARMAKIVVGSENYWVVKFRPMIINKQDMIELSVESEISIVQTKNISVPDFKYYPPTFNDLWKEWKTHKKYKIRAIWKKIWRKE